MWALKKLNNKNSYEQAEVLGWLIQKANWSFKGKGKSGDTGLDDVSAWHWSKWLDWI